MISPSVEDLSNIKRSITTTSSQPDSTPTSSATMIYQLQLNDLPLLIETFPWTNERWHSYMEEQEKNIRIVCLLKHQEKIIGYGTLLKISKYEHFRNNNIPEISDVWIADEHRGKGFGTFLLVTLELLAKHEGFKQVGIGVGLYDGYGQAQRLYFKLGYMPDGFGITHKCVSVIPGDKYPVDDDLILWLTKSLTNSR